MLHQKRRHSPKPSRERERRHPLTGGYKGHPPTDSRYAKRYRQVLVLLILAAVTVYFHVTHTPDEHSTEHASRRHTARNVKTIDTHANPHTDIDKNGRYLAYYPHGAFHTQRLALENALTLCRILDRTLLLPPLWIGRHPRWWSGQSLRYSLANISKPALTHCRDPGRTGEMTECDGYADWTQVSWDWLIDVEMVDVDWVDRWDFSDDWLHREIELGGLGVAEEEVYRATEDKQYEVQITEVADRPDHPYSRHIQLVTLSDLPHRLIHFDSLTGSNRVLLEDPGLLGIKHEIQASTVISNPGILDTMSKITRMFGQGHVAIDARLHGPFESKAGSNMRASWWELGRRLGIADSVLRQAEIDVWRRSPGWRNAVTGDPDGRYPPAPGRIGDRFVEESRAARRLASRPHFAQADIVCPRLKHTKASLLPFNTPLFLTASTEETRTHPALRLFYSTYPCLFTLNTPEIAKIVDKEIGHTVNSLDGYVLSPWLRDWVGWEVAARANELVGTNESAWGQWAEQLVQPIAKEWELVFRD